MTEIRTEFPGWLLVRSQDVIRWALERGRVAPIDDPHDFPRHADCVIWATILRLRAEGASVDYLTVRSALEQRGQLDVVGATYLYELSRDSVRPSDAAVLSAAQEITAAAHDRRARAVLGKHATAERVDLERLRDELRDIDGVHRGAIPVFETLRARLARPVLPTRWRIHGWQPRNSRVMLAAQYKSGKTTIVTNLARCLVDGDAWLGRDRVDPIDGVLTLLDFEMSPFQLDAWLRAQRIRHDDRIHVVPMRGLSSVFDILKDGIRAQWAQQLRDSGSAYLIVDCARPIMDALGLDEHKEAGRLLQAIDALLVEANIQDACVVQHMGHNGERARGDSRFRDWPDAEWRLVRRDENPASPRFITAYGRDVDVPESQLVYDSLSRHLTIEDGSRRDAASGDALDDVLDVLDKAGAPLSGRAIKGKLEDIPRDTVDAALKYGQRIGRLTVQPGAHNAKLYSHYKLVSGVSDECPADGDRVCPGAYISPDTRTLTSTLEPIEDDRTLEIGGDRERY